MSAKCALWVLAKPLSESQLKCYLFIQMCNFRHLRHLPLRKSGATVLWRLVCLELYIHTAVHLLAMDPRPQGMSLELFFSASLMPVSPVRLLSSRMNAFFIKLYGIALGSLSFYVRVAGGHFVHFLKL